MINSGLMRAVRGPVILITVGVLFAVDHAGGLQFERTWPALIIVIGIMKLLERATATPAPQYPPGYQAGAVPYTGTPDWNQYQTGRPMPPPPPPGSYQAPATPPPPPGPGPNTGTGGSSV